MKAKLFLLSITLTLFTLSMTAKTIDLKDAERVAKNFIYVTHQKYDVAVDYNRITIINNYIHQVDGQPVFYAFNLEKGFIIISAEDNFIPVIGYSFEGSFMFDNAPENYKGFILNYADEIKYIRDNQLQADLAWATQWAYLRATDISTLAASRERDVTPLLSCTWDQGSPYNELCPEDPLGPGGHTWVGCVATAMAQIMYYWRYPDVGTGSHCYIPGNISYGQQCANFGETYYGWDGMINGIDNKFPDKNAELQYHCAVSVNMNFNPNGSGSFSYLVPERLNLYFKYNNAQYLEKSSYPLATWLSMLKGDIDVSRPVYYSGFDDSGAGHAFVADGYQGDNIHFNFGWSGSGNGYYSLSDVGGFHNGQAMVRYFYPSDAAYPFYNTGNKVVAFKSGSITDGSGPVNNYLDNVQASWLIDPQTAEDSVKNITLHFVNFDVLPGDTLKIYDGGSSSDSLMGAFSGSTVPSSFVSSGNRLYITFTTDGSDNGKGWYAEYNSTSPTWCSGLTELTEPYGTFDDGSGTFHYQGGSTCMWRIKPQGADQITLYFNYFETEEGVDKVKVYDNNTLIGDFSGNTIPDPVTAYSGTMFITFTTNASTNLNGWEAYYEINNVGVGENKAFSQLYVYPNPAKDKLNIRFDLQENQLITISLLNLTGQTVYETAHEVPAGAFYSAIDVSKQSKGMYILKIQGTSGTIMKKIVIQ